MALQIQKGHTYGPGDTVDYTDLNALVDSAIALKGMITEQTNVDAEDTDHVLIIDSDDGLLKKALVSSLAASGVTEVSATATPTAVFGISVATATTTPVIALTLDSQSQRLFLASPVSGTGVPSFRAISPEDTASVVVPGALLLDWTEGNVFNKGIAAGTNNIKLNDGTPGQVAKVYLHNLDAAATVVHWDTDDGSGAVYWPGGTEPTHSTGLGRVDIYEFLCISAGKYFGVRWGAEFS